MIMSFDTTIDMGELGDQEATVEFDYHRGCHGTFDNPPEPEEVEVTEIIWRGMDIRSDLPADVLTRIEGEAFEYMEDERRQAAEDRAEYLRDCREAA